MAENVHMPELNLMQKALCGRVPTAVSLTYECFVSLFAHSSNVLLDKTGDKATPVSM